MQETTDVTTSTDQFEYGYGDRVRDTITGFEGIVESLAVHLTGCNRIGVRPVADDGESIVQRPDEEFFYPEQLERVNNEEDHAISGPTECDVGVGQLVYDGLNDVQGTATIITFSAFNCPRLCITPHNNDQSEQADAVWVDAPAVEVQHDGKRDDFADEIDSEEANETGSISMDGCQKQSRG